MDLKRIGVAAASAAVTTALAIAGVTAATASSRQDPPPLPPPTTTWNDELPPPPEPGAQVPVMGRDGQPVLNPDGTQRMWTLDSGPPPVNGPVLPPDGPPTARSETDPPAIVGTIEPPVYYIEDLPPQ
jgi:hypothetical protein